MTERHDANDPEMPEDDKLSAREAAEAIGVTRRTLQGYITSGRINTNPDGTIGAAELRRAGFIIQTLPPRLQSLYAQYHQQQPQEKKTERNKSVEPLQYRRQLPRADEEWKGMNAA